MKLFVLLVGIASSLAAPQGLPSFEISGYSRSNIPEMLVTFQNGDAHEMVLEPYSDSPCNFIGHLKTIPSTLAVTGCMNKPGDTMHITLLSDINTVSAMYELDFEGQVSALENPFKHQKERSGKYPLKNREAGGKCENGFEKDQDKMGDEEENLTMELEADAQTSAAVSWPRKQYAYVKFGYDKTMKKQLKKQGTNFATWVDSVMTHVQQYYRHYTLPTKIEFKYDTSETIYKNLRLPNTDFLNNWSQYGKDDADPKVDLYTAFGKDNDYYGTVGLAWVGGACKEHKKTSFNEWRKTPAETAMVVAHEIGHNFGMSHDFDEKHGGDNGKCNGQGIMSYGDAPAKWSACSVSDFTGYYNSRKWGTTCLKSWAPYCGDACPNCGVTPNTICSDPSRFGGCNGRYKSLFDANCKKTCGLC